MRLDDRHHRLPLGRLRHRAGREEGRAHVVGDEQVEDVDARIEPPAHVQGERDRMAGVGDGRRSAASQPPRGCRHDPVGGGVGATVGATVGSGVTPGSPATIRIQPASSLFGSVSSEGMTTRSRPGAARRWCPRPARWTTGCRRRERCTGSRPATPTATAPGSLPLGELEPEGVALAEGRSLPGRLGLGLTAGLQAEISRRTATSGGQTTHGHGDQLGW